MDKKIAVLGAGSIGSSVGADLTDAGLDVTIIDQWPAHVEVMKESGLDITMPDLHLKIPVTAWHLCELAEHVPAFDVVFLAVKSYDTRWLAQLIEPYLKEDGVFIGLQNGMNNEAISDVVGVERTIGSAVELSAEIFTPGIVKRDTTRTGTWFGLGELDGSLTPRLKGLSEVRNLSSSGIGVPTGNGFRRPTIRPVFVAARASVGCLQFLAEVGTWHSEAMIAA